MIKKKQNTKSTKNNMARTMPKRKSKSLDSDKPNGEESKVDLEPKSKYKKSEDSDSKSK